jgi:hypothetical protein
LPKKETKKASVCPTAPKEDTKSTCKKLYKRILTGSFGQIAFGLNFNIMKALILSIILEGISCSALKQFF